MYTVHISSEIFRLCGKKNITFLIFLSHWLAIPIIYLIVFFFDNVTSYLNFCLKYVNLFVISQYSNFEYYLCHAFYSIYILFIFGLWLCPFFSLPTSSTRLKFYYYYSLHFKPLNWRAVYHFVWIVRYCRITLSHFDTIFRSKGSLHLLKNKNK